MVAWKNLAFRREEQQRPLEKRVTHVFHSVTNWMANRARAWPLAPTDRALGSRVRHAVGHGQANQLYETTSPRTAVAARWREEKRGEITAW